MRSADRLPSGGYDPATIAADTERVFAHDWAAVAPPEPAHLVAFARPHLPAGLRGTDTLLGDAARC